MDKITWFLDLPQPAQGIAFFIACVLAFVFTLFALVGVEKFAFYIYKMFHVKHTNHRRLKS